MKRARPFQRATRRATLASFAGAALVSIGCTSTPAYCTDTCAKLEICDSATDELGCGESCEMDRAYAPAYWQGLASCVHELSCAELSSELSDCLGDEARMVPVSGAVDSLCSSMGSRLSACDATIDVGGAEEICRAVGRLYSEDFAGALSGCYDASCDRIDRCLVDAADDYDVTTPLVVFSPETAPRGALTPSALLRMLQGDVYARACSCSGECTANPPPSDSVLACYDEVYHMNPGLYQPAIDCYEDGMNLLDACLEGATTMTECSDCRALYNSFTIDCPSLGGLRDACGS